MDELVTLYTVEPDVRDIYTEGRSDKNFLQTHVVDFADNPLCTVYAVSDRVEIPDGVLIESGIMVGARGRIQWLAAQLATHMPNHASARLIADRDFASVGADDDTDIHGLIYTDYSSMEAYALNEPTISKLLGAALGVPEHVSAKKVLGAIQSTLVALFLIRLCLRESQTGVRIPQKTLTKWDISRHSKDSVVSAFRASLHSLKANERNGLTPEDLLNQYEIYEGRVGNDFRNFSNGHDISLAIILYLKLHCNHVFHSEARRPFQTPKVLEVLLMSCIERGAILEESMFKELMCWASRKNN
ncbi:hypothetical protein [Streptomyces sp. DH8]|uniref:hypothetical protein n=1 Tax=Streptomyces sp. DH8 TaxID=2857008 RepID=UPI001E388083|nr:hypothetical protein [Streptomyces sp. DH8]